MRALLASTVLTSVLGAISAPSPAAAQSCVMQGAACTVSSTGADGKDGAPSTLDTNGNPGTSGSPATALTVSITDTETYHESGLLISPVNVESIGGKGGTGSNASGDSSATLPNYNGGDAGNGASAGNVSVTTGSNVTGIVQNGGALASGITIVSVGGAGGGGGYPSEGGQLGVAGVGGAAGTVSGTIDGLFIGQNNGLYAASVGGAGGPGNDHRGDLAAAAPNGAVGGAGGDVTLTVAGAISGLGSGAHIVSAGGDGGKGGDGSQLDGGSGGDGATGGTGGTVTVILAKGAQLQTNDLGAALWVQSLGGQGGAGGSGGSGGNAAIGGAAGAVSVQLDGTAMTGQDDTSAVLVQSLGGAGASGGAGGSWAVGPNGGTGNSGGAANTVTVTGSGGTLSSGASTGSVIDAPALVAQSIGGGGGSGGKASGWFAIGGSGANGVDGQTVSVNLNDAITTYGVRSGGVIAQSIGGGGGNGGDAQGSGTLVNLVIGGTGGGGGQGGQVLVSSQGVIQTNGDHSAGLMLQSIGGGGGAGGAGVSTVTGAGFGLSIGVGGDGGAGGPGGAVDLLTSTTATNSGRIITNGSDSFGIIGQSIGGGGGIGGPSVANTVTELPPIVDAEIPNVAISVAIGGSGGSGGNAGSVNLLNAGLVATSGQGASGIVGQAIGGGGGTGGDASATATAKGSEVNLTATTALGGSGGDGGNGGSSTLHNTGLVVTTGESADGLLVQSIGGGGGAGGTGDGQAKSSGDGTNISLNLTLGGSGKTGGSGGNATATNDGAILTLGDGASGIMAQSIGGGGGRGGGGAGTASGTYTATVKLGGAGGGGGSTFGTGVVTVTNNGSILTFGADAPAIFAQSIGGGGGVGGKAASSIGTQKSSSDGGNGDQATIGTAYDKLNGDWANGVSAVDPYKSVSGLTGLANTLLGNLGVQTTQVGDDEDGLENLAESGGSEENETQSTSITLKATIGGAGGAGGSAGAINVVNTADIATTGRMSDGILAQAIGGGGGKGGATTSSTSSGDYSASISVGGTGGSGGNGGQPTVTNTANITTIGALAAGIVSQSIAGGGGIGGTSASTANSGKSDGGTIQAVVLTLGGNGGADGQSGQSVVTNSGAIVTQSHDSIGIIGQSIAGGGGIIKTLATDLDNTGGGAKASSSDYAIDLTFGGKGGSAGESGLVKITNSGTITTAGDDSYGVLAQSISGGGGLALGGKPGGPSGSAFFGSGAMKGSVVDDGGDNSGVFVDTSGAITTSGKGAVGIFAQSIGGGGGIAGDTGWTQQLTDFGKSGSHDGSGGAITVTVDQGGSVSTSGDNAPAMIVQSIGGGGGRISNKDGAFNGTAGGTGYGGAVDITVNGSVQATGQASAGIYAQSVGQGGAGTPSTSVINVTVGSGGLVSGGPLFNGNGDTTPGVYIDHGGLTAANPNIVSNSGTITSVGGTQGTAIYSSSGFTAVTNNAGGTLIGAIHLDNNGGSGTVTNNGTLQAGSSISLGGGVLTNNGTLTSGGIGKVASTQINGDYIQGASGTLLVDVDPKTGQADMVTVDGKADIAGAVKINSTALSKSGPLTVLSATGGVTLEASLKSAAEGALISTTTAVVGNTLQAQTNADFKTLAATLGATQQKVAAHLQEVWDSGSSMNGGFSVLAEVTGKNAYATDLNSLSGQALGAIAAVRYQSTQNFINNLYDGCPTTQASPGAPSSDTNCAWGRVVDSWTRRDTTADVLGYTASGETFQAGGQREIAPNLYLGGSVGYETTDLSGAEHTSAVSGKSVLAGATLRYRTGNWLISGGLDAGAGGYDTTRFITVGGLNAVATASPGLWNAGVDARVAYIQPMGAWHVTPFAELHTSYVHSDAYTEAGAGAFNLDVQSKGDVALAAGGGVEIGGQFKLSGKAVLRPFASIAAEFLGDSDWAATAHFVDQTGTGFKASTPLPTTLTKFAIGADIFSSDRWDLRLQYNADLGADYLSQAGVARLAIRF